MSRADGRTFLGLTESATTGTLKISPMEPRSGCAYATIRSSMAGSIGDLTMSRGCHDEEEALVVGTGVSGHVRFPERVLSAYIRDSRSRRCSGRYPTE